MITPLCLAADCQSFSESYGKVAARLLRPALNDLVFVVGCATGLLITDKAAAPYFCATKLEAFGGRGKNDYLASHDLEDLITVVDGRPELLEDHKWTYLLEGTKCDCYFLF